MIKNLLQMQFYLVATTAGNLQNVKPERSVIIIFDLIRLHHLISAH